MLVKQNGMVRVTVSAAMLNMKFNGCELDYILNVCHGRCCDAPSSKLGCMVSVTPSEETNLTKKYNVEVKDNYLQPLPNTKTCPFKLPTGLCRLHETSDKPVGCIFSPFTLNDNNTLIVKNRNKLLKCYNTEPKIPAYKAYQSSLILLFGKEETERITLHLETKGTNLYSYMTTEIFDAVQSIRKHNLKEVKETTAPTGFIEHITKKWR